MMKRTIAITVLLLLFLGAQVAGVLYLNDPAGFRALLWEEETAPGYVAEIQYAQIPVLSGKIVHSYEVEGAVISQAPEQYIEEIVVDYVSDQNFELLAPKGARMEAGEPIYRFCSTTKSVDYCAQLVEFKYVTENYNRKAVIRLLNYDKLYIVAKVSAEKLEALSYDTEVELRIGKERYPSKISEIGYEIIDKAVPVRLDLPVYCLPGTEVKISFVLDVQEAGLYVLKEAVYQDGDAYYAKMLVNGEVVQRELKLGQFFSVEENGNTLEYVELLSGASKGDVFVLEQIDSRGEALKENLKHD